MTTHGGRLPAETTRFFGRSQEAAAIRGALGRSRLVTLTGPGGVGKTRIAVRVAREQAAAFADGVHMVALSGLRDSELLPDTVAGVLGLAGRSGGSSLAALVDYLRGKRMLIILDTCEHLIDACAMLADVILRGADGPRLLATSRQALDIPGEVVYPIPPLAVPDDGGDAVALFADRVAAAVPGFTVTDENRRKIVDLCRGLDGIPLAIELAAVRLRAVGLDELLGRMGDRLRLLASGSRRVTQRHQTLRMTIGWSYELCSDTERVLWTRLSVFAGEFGLSAVETVCSGEPLAADDIIDTLIGLVDKSIVLRADDEQTAEGARYLMLDSVREYGAELLVDGDRYRGRHLAYYLELAREFESRFCGPEQVGWIDRLAREQGNIRDALKHCVPPAPIRGATAAERAAWSASVPPDRVLAGLDLASGCWAFWMATGRLAEGSRWMQRLLDIESEPAPQHVKALWLASWFASARGERSAAAEKRARAREIGARLGVRPGLPPSMEPLAGVLRGLEAVLRGAHERAVMISEDALRELPPQERWVRGSALWVKGLALWFGGDRDGSESCLCDGIALKSGFGDLASVAHHLEALAWLAAADGSDTDAVRVARLQGAADRMWDKSVDRPRYGLRRLDAERARAELRAREVLGARRYADEYAIGGAMSTPGAVGYALGEEGRPPEARSGAVPGAAGGTGPEAAPQPWEQLTMREREVATLVSEGLTNKDIAARLVVSKRTVDAHVEHILSKLGYSSRVQVAALASERAYGAEAAEAAGTAEGAGTGEGPSAPRVPPQRATEMENLPPRRPENTVDDHG